MPAASSYISKPVPPQLRKGSKGQRGAQDIAHEKRNQGPLLSAVQSGLRGSQQAAKSTVLSALGAPTTNDKATH